MEVKRCQVYSRSELLVGGGLGLGLGFLGQAELPTLVVGQELKQVLLSRLAREQELGVLAGLDQDYGCGLVVDLDVVGQVVEVFVAGAYLSEHEGLAVGLGVGLGCFLECLEQGLGILCIEQHHTALLLLEDVADGPVIEINDKRSLVLDDPVLHSIIESIVGGSLIEIPDDFHSAFSLTQSHTIIVCQIKYQLLLQSSAVANCFRISAPSVVAKSPWQTMETPLACCNS